MPVAMAVARAGAERAVVSHPPDMALAATGGGLNFFDCGLNKGSKSAGGTGQWTGRTNARAMS